MVSRDLVSVPVFWSLGLEGLRFRLGLETLHRLFFMKFYKKEFLKNGFKKWLFNVKIW